MGKKATSLYIDGQQWFHAKTCRHTLTRLRGLMFSDPQAALFIFPFPQRVCLHMFFVRFPLTALFLDDDQRVQEIQFLKPWQIGKPARKPVRYVVEIPGHDHDIPIGTQITWDVDKNIP